MTKERACANGSAMSRRTLLSALPVAGAAAALPFAAMAKGSDPMVPVFEEWLEARRIWRELADFPGNEDWDDPRSLAAEARENRAEELMLELAPTSLEGIAALAALAWVYVNPGCANPEEFAERAQTYDCRAVMAIWHACTGRDGYPTS